MTHHPHRLPKGAEEATALAPDAYQLSQCPELAKAFRTGYFPIAMVRQALEPYLCGH